MPVLTIDGGGITGGGRTPPTAPPGPGGGTSNSGSGLSSVNTALVTTTGGLVGVNGVMALIGFQNTASNYLFYQMNPDLGFNCEENCEYDFKIEEVRTGAVPTTHRVLIRYRDLGVCSLMVSIKGMSPSIGDQTVQTPVVKSIPLAVNIGGFNDNLIKTAYVDIIATIEAPQVIITRASFAGNLCIVKVSMRVSYGDGDIA